MGVFEDRDDDGDAETVDGIQAGKVAYPEICRWNG